MSGPTLRTVREFAALTALGLAFGGCIVLPVLFRDELRLAIQAGVCVAAVAAVLAGLRWLARRLVARPPMTEHARDDAARLTKEW